MRDGNELVRNQNAARTIVWHMQFCFVKTQITRNIVEQNQNLNAHFAAFLSGN